MLEQTTTKKRFGYHRWLVLIFIVAMVYVSGQVTALSPHIQLPAENVSGPYFNILGQDFYLTNTLVAMLIADALLILMAFFFWRATRKPDALPKGISGAVEALLEGLYNLTESNAGKWAKSIFPIFATITLMVLVWNWMELIPGVDSIGAFDHHHIPEEAHCEEVDFLGLVGVTGEAECARGVIPFVRVASTDLNFTLALAVIAVVMVQVMGVRALGLGYFTKFFNVRTLFSVPVFGVIDFAVGLLELIGEFAKILSFSFRLFGNIFAGSVLLFVIGSLVPFAQSGFLMLEFFVGLIQAVVFGMLTMVFMSQATISHHGDEHGEEHH
jgi:F-type H+-transporting ATPase subunit a